MGDGKSAESPWPVRTVSQRIAEWIARLGTVWVEGQVTQVSRRTSSGTAFLTLRDPVADVSLTVTCAGAVLDRLEVPLRDGTHVVVQAAPNFYLGRGTLSLQAAQVRAVGVGQLLARIEHLKRVLAAEGVFDAGRKRPLPFLPGVVGLVCGRASAAEKDVVENARRRWPAVRFRIREVAVQGVNAVPEVIAALSALDADPEVEVIVVTRGGGSLEDLLPFSNEALVRAVADCRTPVVSAIGHEVDTPLLDLVADVRASTPTDAAERLVPDMAEELDRVVAARARLRRAVHARLEREGSALGALRSRPVLADPVHAVVQREAQVDALRQRSRRVLAGQLDRAGDDLTHTRARVRALSPAATLERGYAVVRRPDGTVVRSAGHLDDGDGVLLRFHDGERSGRVTAGPGRDGPAHGSAPGGRQGS